VRVEGTDTVADLGGGSFGSSGGNTIGENGENDVHNNTGETVFAKNNFWNPLPPNTFGSVDSSPYTQGVCSVGGIVELPYSAHEAAADASGSADLSPGGIAAIAGGMAAMAVGAAAAGWYIRRRFVRR
jgi:hypothetical protein